MALRNILVTEEWAQVASIYVTKDDKNTEYISRLKIQGELQVVLHLSTFSPFSKATWIGEGRDYNWET